MNVELGLDQLEQHLVQHAPDRLPELCTWEERFLSNRQAERICGISQNTHHEHSQIILALNKFSLEMCNVSFNDLCIHTKIKPRDLKGNGQTHLAELVASSSPLGSGNRWAVLVGANGYEDEVNYGRLHVCVKDVNAVRRRIVAGGFAPERIRLLTDDVDEPPTRNNILTSLKATADATAPDDLLLFYYSGHGDERGGESYLVARDGRRLTLSDTAVPISRIKEMIEQAPARAKVIVLDACHAGADVGKGRRTMSEGFIRRVFEQAEGLAILASCKQGQLSYEWRERVCSVFTHYLLHALTGQADRDNKGFVTVQDVSRHVTDGVKLWASQHKTSQTPTLQYTVAGDIILVRYAD